MANGKYPYFRYRLIHTCLSDKQKRYWTLDELQEKLTQEGIVVKKRSLGTDLHTMRYDELLGYHAPIAFCRKKRGYYYTDPDYSIEKIPLNAKDHRALVFAINTLKKFKDVPLVHQFEGVVEKLGKVADQLPRRNDQVLSFEAVPVQKGMAHFDTLMNAILDKQPLRIDYKKFMAEADVHTFHPYFLKEYKYRWYVLGYSDARSYHLTLGLDRIEGISHAHVKYKENTKLRPDEYFQHTIGVTLGKGRPEEIQLHFTTAQGHYIKTQYLHHTQEIIKDDDDGLIITLKLIPNYELLQLLLSFGPEVEVLKPLTLRKQMAEMVERMMKRYGC